MNAHEARTEFEAGRLSPGQVLDLLERQQRLLQHLWAQRLRLQQRLAHYEPQGPAQEHNASVQAHDNGAGANGRRRTPR